MEECTDGVDGASTAFTPARATARATGAAVQHEDVGVTATKAPSASLARKAAPTRVVFGASSALPDCDPEQPPPAKRRAVEPDGWHGQEGGAQAAQRAHAHGHADTHDHQSESRMEWHATVDRSAPLEALLERGRFARTTGGMMHDAPHDQGALQSVPLLEARQLAQALGELPKHAHAHDEQPSRAHDMHRQHDMRGWQTYLYSEPPEGPSEHDTRLSEEPYPTSPWWERCESATAATPATPATAAAVATAPADAGQPEVQAVPSLGAESGAIPIPPAWDPQVPLFLQLPEGPQGKCTATPSTHPFSHQEIIYSAPKKHCP